MNNATTFPTSYRHARHLQATARLTRDAALADVVPLPIKTLVFLWALVCLSTNLKVDYIPYIDWCLSVPVLLWTVRYFQPHNIVVQASLLFAILVGGAVADNMPTALAWSGKLVLMFTALSSFRFIPTLMPALQLAFVVSVYGNVACLILGQLGMTFFADVMTSEGRVGTILNLPGSLWHVGMSLLFYYVYMLFIAPGRKLWNMVSAIACLSVIYCDGGRTAILFVLLLPSLLLYVFFRERRVVRFLPTAACIALAGLALLSTLDIEQSAALNRIMPLLTGEATNVDGLAAFDDNRFQMLQKAKDLIYEHPIAGNGLHAAAVVTNSEAQDVMVVHNAYLQLWADFGLLGLVSFAIIVLGWVSHAFGWLRAIVILSDPQVRSRYFNALFSLLWFALSLLFHPFSCEWSEWILFLPPYCLLMNLDLQTRSGMLSR